MVGRGNTILKFTTAILAVMALATVLTLALRPFARELEAALIAFDLACLMVLAIMVIQERRAGRSVKTRQEAPAAGRGLDPTSLTIGIVLIVLAVLDVAFAVSLSTSSDVAVVVILLLLVGGGGIGGYIIFRLSTAWVQRRANARVVVGAVAAIVRQNLPLAAGLTLAADSERGRVRRDLDRIARLLADGLPLSEAVRHGYPDCPSMALSLIIAGERAGQLPAALEQAEQYLIQRDRRRLEADDQPWLYMLVLLTLMVLIFSWNMIAVIPKYKEIFKNFNATLPGITVGVIRVSAFVADSGLGAVLGVLFLVAIPTGMYLSFRPRRVPQLSVVSRLADWIRWHTPGLGRLERSAGLAVVIRVMQLGVRAGMSLEQAAGLAAVIDVNQQLRPRIGRFVELLCLGTGVREAARQAGLGEVNAVALAAGQRSGDMPAALEYAAEYHDGMVSRVWVLLRSLTWPVCTLLVGLVVATVVLALFLPLIALINSVQGV